MREKRYIDSFTLYQKLKELGVYISNHESDLYTEVTPETTALCKKRYRFSQNVTVFRNEVTGKMNYEIPFAYMPFWEKKHCDGKNN